MSATEKLINDLSDELNSLQVENIRQVSAITKHGYTFINLHIRADGRYYHFEADWLANILNPRRP